MVRIGGTVESGAVKGVGLGEEGIKTYRLSLYKQPLCDITVLTSESIADFENYCTDRDFDPSSLYSVKENVATGRDTNP